MTAQKTEKNGNGTEKTDGKPPLAQRIALKVPMIDDSLNRLPPQMQEMPGEDRTPRRFALDVSLVQRIALKVPMIDDSLNRLPPQMQDQAFEMRETNRKPQIKLLQRQQDR